MKKPTLLFTLNILAFTCLLFLASSGLQLEYVLKQGTTTWGLTRHVWLDIHFWTALTFLAVIGAHVAVHWKWIRAMVKGRNPTAATKRYRVAIAIVAVLVAVAVSPFFLARKPPPPAASVEAQPAEVRRSATAAQVESDSDAPAEDGSRSIDR